MTAKSIAAVRRIKLRATTMAFEQLSGEREGERPRSSISSSRGSSTDENYSISTKLIRGHLL